jgi:integrase
VRWKKLLANPFSSLPVVDVPQRSPQAFTSQQASLLVSSIREEWMRDLVTLALMTGMRRGELRNLRWSDIDFGRGHIRIESRADFKTKSGRRRVIPINSTAQQVLRRMAASRQGELVFNDSGNPIPDYIVSIKLKRSLRKAGLPNGLHFHSLRHSHTTWLVNAGVSLYEVQKLLGHCSIVTTQIYAHLVTSELHSAVSAISIPVSH